MLILVDYENVHTSGMTGFSALSSEDTVVIFYGNAIKSIPFDLHIEIMNSKVTTEYIKVNKVGKNYLDFQLASHLGYCIGKGYNGQIFIISKDTGYDSIVDLWTEKGCQILRAESIDAAVKKLVTPQNAKEEAKTATKKASSSKKTASNTKKVPEEKPADAKTESKTKKQTASTDNSATNKKAVSADNGQAAKTTTQAMPDKFPESFRKKVRTAVKGDQITASHYTNIYKFMLECATVTDYKSRLVQSIGKNKGREVFAHTQDIYTEFHK